MTTQKKPASDFAQAALALDAEFTTLEQLSRQLERLSVESDKGLERAGVLLGEVEACRERLGAAMAGMAQAFDAARLRNEQAARLVVERAAAIQERRQIADGMITRFKALAEMVRQVNEGVVTFRKQTAGGLSPEDRLLIEGKLPQLNEQMAVLVDEARRLMDDARAVKLETLERNADSLRQSLQGAMHRLEQALAPRSAATPDIVTQ